MRGYLYHIVIRVVNVSVQSVIGVRKIVFGEGGIMSLDSSRACFYNCTGRCGEAGDTLDAELRLWLVPYGLIRGAEPEKKIPQAYFKRGENRTEKHLI